MKSLYLKIILIFIFFLIVPKHVFAIADPLTVPNNKYGIHIIDENDIRNAADLVNTSGGDWGYVTMVIADNNRDTVKWNHIFNLLNEVHLIPIIRLATHVENGIWTAPSQGDASVWANFLNTLHWVVKNRYVILFNEPNHSVEWGNSIDPAAYTDILRSFSNELKSRSKDFFILPAGLDASAPNGQSTMDETMFLKQMYDHDPRVFDLIDGWVSHSYPNPGFKAPAEKIGRESLKTYQWEISYLRTLGFNKHLPIFITETGWPHKEGDATNISYYNAETVAELFLKASQIIWIDSTIVAVTPFIFNYQSYPFSHFSWKKLSSNEYYPQYHSYQAIPKVKGQPIIDDSKRFWNLPEFLARNLDDKNIVTSIASNKVDIVLVPDFVKRIFHTSFLTRFISLEI